jgi:hypothetical protein
MSLLFKTILYIIGIWHLEFIKSSFLIQFSYNFKIYKTLFFVYYVDFYKGLK